MPDNIVSSISVRGIKNLNGLQMARLRHAVKAETHKAADSINDNINVSELLEMKMT